MRFGQVKEQNGTMATYHVPATRQLWVFYGNVATCLFMFGCVLFMAFVIGPGLAEIRDTIHSERAAEADYLKSIKTARQEHLKLEMDLVVHQDRNLRLAKQLESSLLRGSK